MRDLDNDGSKELAVLVDDDVPGEVSTELGLPMPVYEVYVEVVAASNAPFAPARA